MGLFNYVNFSTKCPCCGVDLKDFQSKDGDTIMTTVEPWEVSNFYTSCDFCKCWVEYTIKDQFNFPNIKHLVEAGQNLIKAIEDHLELDSEIDKTYLKQAIKDHDVFSSFIDWLDYYDLKVTPPT